MTELTDERLRTLYAPVVARRPVSRDGCPAPEQILAVVRREGTEDDRLATLDHVMSCTPCHSDFELLRAVGLAEARSRETENIEALADVRSLRKHRVSRWMRWGGGLLAASVAVSVGLNVMRTPASNDVTRGAADSETVALVAPDVAPVDAARGLQLTWHAVPSAVSYTAEVIDANGAVVLSKTTSDSVATFSPESALKPDQVYQWWVRALTTSGTDRKSLLRTLRVK